MIGNYSKGKTFLLELLTRKKMPHGFNVNTQGISIVYLKDEENKQLPVIALDTKGGGNPLDLSLSFNNEDTAHSISEMESDSLTEKLRDHGATEDLLQNFILEEASIIIVVVADLTFDDQKLVNKIKSKFKAHSTKKIIVVHNLYHSHHILDVQAKIKNSILTSFPLVENEFLNKEKSKNDIYYVDKSKNMVPHVILAKQYSEAGDYYNEPTINYIKDNLNSNDNAKSVDIIQAFHGYIQNHCNDYIQGDSTFNKDDIKLIKTDEGKPAQLKLENIKSIKMKAVYADVFGDLQVFKDGLQLNYTLYLELASKEEKLLCLKIECPEECTDVKVRIQESLDDFWIEVKGKKNSLNVDELLIDNRQCGEFLIKTATIRKTNYSVNRHDQPQKSYLNGMYIFKWKVFKENSDW